MMRRWHATGNFCAHQCVDCTEWSWWNPTPIYGGGTGGKVNQLETEEDEQVENQNGSMSLPIVQVNGKANEAPPTAAKRVARWTRNRDRMSSNGTHAAVTRVGWIGPRPSWLEDEQLKGIVLVGDRSKADVIHAVVAAGDLARLDRDVPSTSALVVHLQNADRLQAAQARRLARARIILVDSPVEWASVKHRLPKADVRVLRAQVDLDWFAPEPQLTETKLRGRDLRRFRRFHRLAGPVVLFAGPYTRAGGMSRVLEVVFRDPEVRAGDVFRCYPGRHPSTPPSSMPWSGARSRSATTASSSGRSKTTSARSGTCARPSCAHRSWRPRRRTAPVRRCRGPAVRHEPPSSLRRSGFATTPAGRSSTRAMRARSAPPSRLSSRTLTRRNGWERTAAVGRSRT